MNFPENVKYSSDHEWVRVEAMKRTWVLQILHRRTG